MAVIVWLETVAVDTTTPVELSLTSAEPQYQRADMYICCVPCTIQALRTQSFIGAPPSSPKFRAKNKEPLEEATA